MSSLPRFHDLRVLRVSPEAAGAVAVTLVVPPPLRSVFDFLPGQYLTLRATIDGVDVRRNYSICSARQRYLERGELEVGIRPVPGGVFSNWAATQLQPGTTLQVMPPDGRFVVKRPRAIHRVGFAAGSGITPILSIMASTLQDQPTTQFTLIYGNRSMDTVMFNEALQDLKDRYRDRLTLIHVLSRQAQEVDLLQGHIDTAKVHAIIAALLPAASMDEVFVCGPQAMIDATVQALQEAGVPERAIRTERFTSPTLEALPESTRHALTAHHAAQPAQGDVALTVRLDGKDHAVRMRADTHVLDAALAAGLDLPFACKGGVCATCRCKVLEGGARMDKNFGLEPDELARGFVLSCQARPTGLALTVSFDER